MRIFKHNHFIMLILLWSSIAWADNHHPNGIIIDGTIGSKQFQELQGPDYQILAKHGEIKGNNLFHSFQTFNIHKNEQVTFYGPDNIQNIISRVTGNEHSWIDGRIQSFIPDADFFFVEPKWCFLWTKCFFRCPGIFSCEYLRLYWFSRSNKV